MEQKRGEGKQRFKKGGSKLGQRVGALKRGGAGTPLRTMPTAAYVYIKPSINTIVKYARIWVFSENTGQRKPVFLHILIVEAALQRRS